MFTKKHICLGLLLFIGNYLCDNNDKWDSGLTYENLIKKAQEGSPYFQGLLGIYLR